MSENSEVSEKAQSLRALFDVCYREAIPYFERAVEVQNAYEEGPESERGSDVNFPLIWQLVESALPTLWSGAFPRANFIKAISSKKMKYDALRDIERFAEGRVQMSDIRGRGLMTVKDALKFGRGYGLVETQTMNMPAEVLSILVGGNGVSAGEMQQVDNYVDVAKYVYLPYYCVIPTPETDNVEDVSGVFVFRPLTEIQVRTMYAADEALPKEQRKLKLSAESVLKRTEDLKLNARAWPLFHLFSRLGGNNNAVKRYEKMSDIMRAQEMYDSKSSVTVVPVIQCKFQDEEVWLANGDQIIYEQKGVNAIRKDLVTASIFPDSDNWWCHGIGSRALDLDAAENIMFQMILDIAARFGDPVKMINATLLENPPENVMPGDTLRARSMASGQRGIEYITGPDIPQSMIAMGMQMMDQGTRTAGINPQALGQGSPGVMRAGSAGFESWLSTATGREKLMENNIREGWLLPAIQLIMLQTKMNMSGREDFTLYDVKNAEYVQKSVTREAFASIMDWRLDLNAKYDLSTQDKGMRLSTYVQVMKDNPMYDQEAASIWASGDDPSIERLIATPEKRREQEEALQRRAQAAQEQTAPGMESPATQGMAANMMR